ncbi:protein hook [Aphis craccivora]|uniref:Protein hook n=1 Tax=Aphis craccivora TaxID=307492 RepID=A0A6G0VND0_APHCR|nr:protein hook [Aphis craccivora]
MDEAMLRWETLMLNNMIVSSKDKEATILKYSSDATISTESSQKLHKAIKEKSKKSPIKDLQTSKMKVNSFKTETFKQIVNNQVKQNKIKVSKPEVNRYGKNFNLSNTNKYELLKHEMEKMNNYMEQLNKTLQTITVELSREKSINNVSINSVIDALDRYQNLKLKQNTIDGVSYKEKLDTIAKEVENIQVEKKHLQKRLEESNIALVNVNEKILALSENSDNEYDKKLNEIEEERNEWNDYQTKLEKLIIESYKALSRKDEYIKNQDFIADNLRKEKLDLETRVNEPILELQLHQSEEIENYQNKIKKLSAIIADMNRALISTRESHNMAISEMR